MPRRKNSFSSDLTYIILLILRHSLTPTRYISLLTGEPSKKVSKYLNFLKKRGLVKYENGFWTLSSEGERIAARLFKFYSAFLLNNQLKNNIDENKEIHQTLLNNYLKNNTDKNKKTTKIQIYSNLFKDIQINSNLFKETGISSSQVSSKTTKTLDQVLFKAREFLGKELSDIERAIVEFLFSFSSSRGRKYWWPEDSLSLAESLASKLSQSLGISISSIDVSYALKELEAAGVIFITYDKRRRVPKIRISRALFS